LPFHGINDHSLDAKNRLTVPAKSRAALSNTVTLTMAFDGCLELWPAAEYAQIVKQALAPLNPMSAEARELKRHFYGNSTTVELDSAGRVMLPPDFIAHAGLGKDVKVIGAGDYLELWDREAYGKQNADLIQRAADHIQSVGHPA
jgi:MraZ protein